MQKNIIFFLGFLFISLKAHAFEVRHDFFVTVGNFDASKTEFTYSLLPDSYQIASKVSTYGFFNTIYPFAAEYTTAGKISKNKLITTDYQYTSSSRFKTRSKQVFYDADGIPLYQISTRNGKNKKRDFSPSPSPADTFDLQTVIAKLARQYNTLGFCDSRLAIFDGKRRFDVVFKDEGNDILPPNEHSFFSGEATKCSLHIDKSPSEDDDTLWQFSANRPIYFWMARDTSSKHPFVAKIQIKDTPLGELNAYTTKIAIKE